MSMISLEKPVFRAVGVMSGTSMDAIDVALIETNGENYVKSLKFASFDMPKALKNELLSLIKVPHVILQGELSTIRDEVTLAHVKAVQDFIGNDDYDVVGFHGQTVLHRPQDKITVQLFNGVLAQNLLKKTVVCNFREKDVLAEGQGAPLVPIYHKALSIGLELPIVFLNLGGVANITFMGDDLIAFDTGPASALIDDLMRERAGCDFDASGAFASRGIVNEALLNHALNHDFFKQKPPKSLDRNTFSLNVEGLSLEDGAATLTAFSVQSIILGIKMLPAMPKAVYVMGGGRKNDFMMRELAKALPCSLIFYENGDSVEAECFAYLAVRRLKNLPLSFPLTTGVKEPLTGGDVFF